MPKVNSIHQLKREGDSVSEISRKLGIARASSNPLRTACPNKRSYRPSDPKADRLHRRNRRPHSAQGARAGYDKRKLSSIGNEGVVDEDRKTLAGNGDREVVRF